jgi:pyruvate kinase
VQNELAIIWSVEPVIHSPVANTDDLMHVGERALIESGIVKRDELIVVMAGKLSGLGLSRTMKLYTVGEAEQTPPAL